MLKITFITLHDYLQFRLLFGKNPRITGSWVDKPPAFDGKYFVYDYSGQFQCFTQVFVSRKSSEKLRRTLWYSVRSSCEFKVFLSVTAYKRITWVDQQFFSARMDKFWSNMEEFMPEYVHIGWFQKEQPKFH